MRIAYVTETYPPELNGVSLTVERTVRYLRARGHRVELIRPRQPGEDALCQADEWRTAGCPLPMYRDLRFGFATPAALRKRFEANRPQLVHVATEGPLGWAAVRAARALGLVATSDFRTNFHQYSRYYGLGHFEAMVGHYLRRFHNRTQRTFVPTRAVRDELAAAGFERLQVVGRGVDTARFDPAHRRAELRAQWLPQGDAPVLLYVGRLAAEKNVALALRAGAAARRAVPGARMVVVGDGPMRRRLQAAHPEALFVGAQRGDDLAAHYASADLFLFPSLSETFGNVTLEALASGLPVVAFDAAAAAQHVDAHCGRLIAPGSDSEFIAAAVALTQRHAELQPLRRAARSAALKANWDSVLSGFERELGRALFEEATAASGVAYVA